MGFGSVVALLLPWMLGPPLSLALLLGVAVVLVALFIPGADRQERVIGCAGAGCSSALGKHRGAVARECNAGEEGAKGGSRRRHVGVLVGYLSLMDHEKLHGVLPSCRGTKDMHGMRAPLDIPERMLSVTDGDCTHVGVW